MKGDVMNIFNVTYEDVRTNQMHSYEYVATSSNFIQAWHECVIYATHRLKESFDKYIILKNIEYVS